MSHPDPRDDGDDRRQEDDLRRSEEEALAESMRAAAYLDRPYTPDYLRHSVDIGVDGSFGYRERIYNDQIRANMEYSQKQKERK